MKIGFIGTHSTGKTTLAECLRTEEKFKDYFFDVNVTRWVRSLGFDINEKTNNTSQELNMVKRIAHLNSYDNIIADRTIIDVLAYSKAGRKYGGITKESLEYQEELVLNNIQKYDFIFYLLPEIDIEYDGIRPTSPEYRVEIDQIINEYIKTYEINHHVLKGSVRERINKIMEITGE